MNSESICHHDFNGFCRNWASVSANAARKCPHGHHFDETCDIGPLCKDVICHNKKRHPKKCKYFAIYGFCKLEKECRYNHFDISQFVLEIKSLVASNSEQLKKINSTLDEISKAKSYKDKKQITKEINCDICNRDFISKSGLTRHIKAKHSGSKIPHFNIFDDETKPELDNVNEEKTEPEPCPEIDDDDETSSINIDSDDNENDIKTCLDKQDEGLSKKERQREISLAVLERFADFEQRQEIKNEIEDAKYLTIPKHYKNLKNNRVFKHDEDFPPLVSTKDENLMLTFTFNEISNVEIDHLALASDDIGKIEISNYDQEKNDLYFRDPGPNDNYDTRSDVHESPECGNDNKNQENFQAAKEYVLFSHIVEKNISQYF